MTHCSNDARNATQVSCVGDGGPLIWPYNCLLGLHEQRMEAEGEVRWALSLGTPQGQAPILPLFFWQRESIPNRWRGEAAITCFSSGGSLLHSLPNILVISGKGTSGLFARSCSRRSFMKRTYPVRGDFGALLSRRGFFRFLPLDHPPRLLLCYKTEQNEKQTNTENSPHTSQQQ